MRSTLSQVIASALRVDWSRLEGLAALRCAVGVATPLLLGLAIDQPLVGVFGAAGAFGVGFGSFQTSQRKARTARNPQTGATVKVPKRRVVRFKAGKALKEAVN